MITKLSKYQNNLLHDISMEWLVNILTRKGFDVPLINKTLVRLYDIYRLPKPPVIYAEGPLHCQSIAADLREEAAERGVEWKNISGVQQQYDIECRLKHILVNKFSTIVKQEVWSKTAVMRLINFRIEEQLDKQSKRRIERFSPDGLRAADYCCYNDFLKKLSTNNFHSFDRSLLSGYDGYRDFVFNSGIFFSIYSESNAIICPGPAEFRVNDKMELHCTDGPALAWEDGFRLYYLNGIPMSEVFFLPAHEIDPVLILRERNAEARREIIRKVGIEKVIRQLGAKVVDKWGNYELLVLDIPDMQDRPTYLKMLNPSVGVWHIEGVPSDITSCRKALAWRDEEGEYNAPEELT
jgi:hypothetical protein